ncbi:uncharacterized protein A4U43_C07F20420 [Asparagus officinalis]|uniref:Uncharacterized protein n=1 Tax=Asparagus officinalis TaxID=4686 RepID=A0A5P1EDN6_ASPOF|nr:uncharacterized protein A4U43_C07F20420 [Asparagus officinalis]
MNALCLFGCRTSFGKFSGAWAVSEPSGYQVRGPEQRLAGMEEFLIDMMYLRGTSACSHFSEPDEFLDEPLLEQERIFREKNAGEACRGTYEVRLVGGSLRRCAAGEECCGGDVGGVGICLARAVSMKGLKAAGAGPAGMG